MKSILERFNQKNMTTVIWITNDNDSVVDVLIADNYKDAINFIKQDEGIKNIIPCRIEIGGCDDAYEFEDGRIYKIFCCPNYC